MFAAGAYSTALDAGMEKDSADRFVSYVCKEASARRIKYDDYETWWSRNKGWALPALLTSAAFWVGADAVRNGRPDRGYLENAGSLAVRRIKELIGYPDSPLWGAATEVRKDGE